ncbi:MAG: hypothetical protein H0X51_09000 [Parachlamydiaceae bacterium]|nr:hypothetical protein [Parachlamydiaceae bacterium]
MSTYFRLQQELQQRAGKKVQLKINDNRSTMLSVRWEPDCTKVSLHRMFLQAPQNIMQALACYLRQEVKIMSPNIKHFIEENVKKLDYSHTIDRKKLCSQGTVYNLQEMYQEINNEYFDGKLQLSITWFGKPFQRGRSKVTFGLYHDPLRLIKIHRMLDNPFVPDYLIAFVIYHEMLHYVCPAYRDINGIQRIHSKEFKQMEMRFRHYELAQYWIKEHYRKLFRIE